jgi:uncharacterized lipoprotein YajG
MTRNIQIGTKIFINGQSETIELTIVKIGYLYAKLDNPNYRYLRHTDVVEIVKGANKGSFVKAFNSPQDAEYWLEGQMQKLGYSNYHRETK